jgi:hypothetical protein
MKAILINFCLNYEGFGHLAVPITAFNKSTYRAIVVFSRWDNHVSNPRLHEELKSDPIAQNQTER